jgi:hypothetical protein
MNTVTIILKTIARRPEEFMGRLRAKRPWPEKDPEYYTYERGHYSVEEERKAALKVSACRPTGFSASGSCQSARHPAVCDGHGDQLPR